MREQGQAQLHEPPAIGSEQPGGDLVQGLGLRRVYHRASLFGGRLVRTPSPEAHVCQHLCFAPRALGQVGRCSSMHVRQAAAAAIPTAPSAVSRRGGTSSCRQGSRIPARASVCPDRGSSRGSPSAGPRARANGEAFGERAQLAVVEPAVASLAVARREWDGCAAVVERSGSSELLGPGRDLAGNGSGDAGVDIGGLWRLDAARGAAP
jgi:hypothetical protein